MRLLIAALCALFATSATAQAQESLEDGLAAWDKIYATASHPRCTNCHVGESGRPSWSGLGFREGTLHGMAVQADESRIGAESIPCRTCHMTSTAHNTVPHAPPHISEAWRLPPIELSWIGKSSVALCKQLRDPETTDGQTLPELIEHVKTSPFVAWGFKPGAGREGAPGSPQELAQYLAVWNAAGAPCVDDS